MPPRPRILEEAVASLPAVCLALGTLFISHCFLGMPPRGLCWGAGRASRGQPWPELNCGDAQGSRAGGASPTKDSSQALSRHRRGPSILGGSPPPPRPCDIHGGHFQTCLPFSVSGGEGPQEQGTSHPTHSREEDRQHTELGEAQSCSPSSSAFRRPCPQPPGAKPLLPEGARRMLGCVEVFLNIYFVLSGENVCVTEGPARLGLGAEAGVCQTFPGWGLVRPPLASLDNIRDSVSVNDFVLWGGLLFFFSPPRTLIYYYFFYIYC